MILAAVWTLLLNYLRQEAIAPEQSTLMAQGRPEPDHIETEAVPDALREPVQREARPRAFVIDAQPGLYSWNGVPAQIVLGTAAA